MYTGLRDSSLTICLHSPQAVDSALISTVSYPAFATHEDILVSYTKANIVKKLKGRYGFKRFKRDGYQCAIEDRNRAYYNVGETKVSKKTNDDNNNQGS